MGCRVGDAETSGAPDTYLSIMERAALARAVTPPAADAANVP
jgi:hypothetical protein